MDFFFGVGTQDIRLDRSCRKGSHGLSNQDLLRCKGFPRLWEEYPQQGGGERGREPSLETHPQPHINSFNVRSLL